MAKRKHAEPRIIPAITSEVKWTERYIRLKATNGKIIDVRIRNNRAENLFFIKGVIKKIEERRKIVAMVAWALGKLKPCSRRLYGRALCTKFFITNVNKIPRGVPNRKI